MALAIILAILASFAIFAGVQLYLMQSDLYAYIRSYARAACTVIVLLVVLLFLFRLSIDALGLGFGILWMIIFGAVFALLDFGADTTQRKLLVLKKDGKRSVLPSGAIALTTVLDILVALVVGISVGASYYAGYGMELFLLVAVVLFMILRREARINKLESLVVPQKAIYLNLFLTLAGLTGGLILGAFLPEMTNLGDKILVLPTSYMIYLLVWNGYFLVRVIRK